MASYSDLVNKYKKRPAAKGVNKAAIKRTNDIANKLEKMAGPKATKVVNAASRKAGAIVVKDIKAQIRAKGWSKKAWNQPRLKKAKMPSGTVLYTVLYDTPKGSKLAPYMLFQDWGTNTGVEPQLFEKKAYDKVGAKAGDVLISEIAAGIKKNAP